MVRSQPNAHPTEHTIQNWQQAGLGKKAMKAIYTANHQHLRQFLCFQSPVVQMRGCRGMPRWSQTYKDGNL